MNHKPYFTLCIALTAWFCRHVRDCTLSWCDGLCISMTHWAILGGIFIISHRASLTRCLRSIANFSWKQRLSNKDVQHCVFGVQKQSRRLDQIALGTRMRCLGHVLRMENFWLSRKFLLSEPKIGWKRLRGGQVMTWHRKMKESTGRLAAVGLCRPPGRGPRDSAHKWLSTLEDMARDRCQWRSCWYFLIDLHDS